jgi:SAM-dependent methyltransferase
VLDVGCGKGEILARAMTRLDARSVGVDPNPAFIAEARERLQSAGLTAAADLRCATREAAGLPEHAFDVVFCIGAAHAFGSLGDALRGLAMLVRGRGWAMVGHGYWVQEPDPKYLAAFGGSMDELDPLAKTLAAPARHGWANVTHHLSTRAEWDDYEHAYAGAVRGWLANHPNDEDAPAFRERIESWWAAYEHWGCMTMGFVTMVLRRDS